MKSKFFPLSPILYGLFLLALWGEGTIFLPERWKVYLVHPTPQNLALFLFEVLLFVSICVALSTFGTIKEGIFRLRMAGLVVSKTKMADVTVVSFWFPFMVVYREHRGRNRRIFYPALGSRKRFIATIQGSNRGIQIV